MLHRFFRASGAALAVLLMAQFPCFAQLMPVPPPQDQNPVSLGRPEASDLPNQPKIPTENGLPRTNEIFDIQPFCKELWDGLCEPPPLGFVRNQAAGFGFGQTPAFAPSYRVTWIPDASVPGQGTNLSSVQQDFHMAIPLYLDSCQMIGLTTGVRNVLYSTNAYLSGSPAQPIPDNLWDVRFGVTYKYTFSNGWVTGGDINFGSASDRPFENVHQLTVGVSTFLRIPVGEHNAWLFSLSYSPTGELNFPVPGVGFYWQPSDSFNALIGIPAKVMWRPIEDVTLEASYMPLTTVRARAMWRVWGGIYLYAAYDLGDESYFIANNSDDRERLFYYDQRVTGGVKMRFGPHFIVDVSSGYAFDRYFFEGDSFRDQQTNRIDVGNSPFLSLMMELRF